MSKFKKGDIVRITATEHQHYWNKNMDKYIGMLAEVAVTTAEDSFVPNDGFMVIEKTKKEDIIHFPKLRATWYFRDDDAELVCRPSTEPDAEASYEKGYKKGSEEAWETAKRILVPAPGDGFGRPELRKIFGDFENIIGIFFKYSAEEARKLIEEYDQRETRKALADAKIMRKLRKLVETVGPMRLREMANEVCDDVANHSF